MAITLRMLCGLIRPSQAAPFGGVADADGANSDAQGARDFAADVRRGAAVAGSGRRVGVGSTGVRVMLQRFRASELA
jgi:hypothetical protein